MAPTELRLRRAATLLVAAAAAVAAILAVTGRTGPAGAQLLAFVPVRPRLSAACSGCLSSILRENPPWASAPSFDPKHAMLCVSASCASATLAARPARGAQELSGLPAGAAAPAGASSAAKLTAEMRREQQRLDAQQLELNWQRARLFSQFVGPPGTAKAPTMVLADFVPPLDPQGRPVPAWLKFTPAGQPAGASPAGAATASGLFGVGGAWDPEAAHPFKVAPTTILTNNTNCYALDTCSTCLGGGCAWCHGAEVCGTSCPRLWNVQMFTQLDSCPAPANVQAQEQAQNTRELEDLTRMSRKSETGDELVKSITTEERRVANATDLEMDASKLTFYPLAKAPFLQDRGDVRTVESPFMPPSLRKAVEAAGEAVTKDGKISLATAMAPLNAEQAKLNAKREMLFFRTETGVATGMEPDEIYSHTVGGGGQWDNWAKPTTTWSLVGRPTPGWLHWGNDNDGGYFNPVGGSEWDPQMLDPAANKGTWGPATNRYRVRHPHPEDESSMVADSPLFGA